MQRNLSSYSHEVCQSTEKYIHVFKSYSLNLVWGRFAGREVSGKTQVLPGGHMVFWEEMETQQVVLT